MEEVEKKLKKFNKSEHTSAVGKVITGRVLSSLLGRDVPMILAGNPN